LYRAVSLQIVTTEPAVVQYLWEKVSPRGPPSDVVRPMKATQ